MLSGNPPYLVRVIGVGQVSTNALKPRHTDEVWPSLPVHQCAGWKTTLFALRPRPGLLLGPQVVSYPCLGDPFAPVIAQLLSLRQQLGSMALASLGCFVRTLRVVLGPLMLTLIGCLSCFMFPPRPGFVALELAGEVGVTEGQRTGDPGTCQGADYRSGSCVHPAILPAARRHQPVRVKPWRIGAAPAGRGARAGGVHTFDQSAKSPQTWRLQGLRAPAGRCCR